MKYKYIEKDKVWKSNDIIRILDIDGQLIDKKFVPSVKLEKFLEAYKTMVLSRQQDTYMSQLQRQGRMLTFAPNFGEEAVQAGAAMAMKKEDWLIPSFRSNTAMLMKGVPLLSLLLYWNGNEKGSIIPKGVNVTPSDVVIATQCSHAAGVAYSLKHQNKKAIAVTFVGDGGTSEGEFYESINMASVHKWPAIICVSNNQWAISTPTKEETAAQTIAAKAIAVGMASLRVDGNDLVANFEAMNEAADYARNNNGPVLIEFVTWRQGPHTTSDNPRLYRTREDEEAHEKWEPMHRIKNYLIANKVWNEAKDEALWASTLEEVKKAYQKSIPLNTTDINDVFDYTYETLPAELKEQKTMAVNYLKMKGGK